MVIEQIIQEALSYKGTPYQWGGFSRQGIDCSGLMVKAFQAGGFNIPRVAGDQAKIGPMVEVDELIPGDLVFFTDHPGNMGITHVGLVSVTNFPTHSITFVHASSSKGVMESELLSPYWQGVYLGAVRPSAFLG